MTISSTNRKAGPYAGNDVAVAFPFSFKVFSSGDPYIVRTDPTGTESVLSLTADYTVALNADQDANPGGTITLSAALATGYSLTIASSLPYLQPTDLTNNGGFYPKVITNALDRLTIFAQQLAEQMSRALKYSISSPLGDSALPTPVANNVIGWNSSANGFQNYAPVDNTLLSTSLAAPSGSSLIGHDDVVISEVFRSRVGRVVDSIATLRTLSKSKYTRAFVTGYYSPGDGGGGHYYYDAADTSSSDNGGTVIVASDGGRWKLIAQSSYSVKQFGAKVDGVTNDYAAVQATFTAVNSIFFPYGRCIISTGITANGAKRVFGEGQSQSVLVLGATISGIVFSNVDTYGLAVSDMAIEGNGSSTAISIASSLEQTAHAHFEALRIYNHANGITGTGTYTLFDSYLEKVDFLQCSGYGFKLSGSQNTLVSCSFRNCGWGILIDQMAGGYSIGGATLEGGVFVGNTYDIVTNTTTIRPLSFRNVWFEQTGTMTFGKLTGASEVFFTTMTFDGCLFQPKATAAGNGVIDGFNYKGVVSFRNCIVYTDLYASATLPAESVGLSDTNTIVARQSCCTVNGAGTVTPLKDFTTNSKFNLYNVFDTRKYANDAAAGTGGLTYGDLYYNTSTASVSMKN